MAETALVHGELIEKTAAAIVLGLLGTDYRLHLMVDATRAAQLPAIGQRLSGTIQAQARRVDVVQTGGRLIEPVYGRPRRVQGRIVATDFPNNTITVRCAPECALLCTLAATQKAQDFAAGQFVAFDIEPGASFA